jgi:hypothetical protein
MASVSCSFGVFKPLLQPAELGMCRDCSRCSPQDLQVLASYSYVCVQQAWW